MTGYTHTRILINQREAALSEIISGSAASFSDFESATFSFIRNWLRNNESFTLHTSGSTGVSKEIILSRNQLRQSAQRTIKALQLLKDQTAFVCLDTKYIAGQMMLVRAFETDMHIVASEPSSQPLKSIDLTIQPDFAALVPLQLEESLKNDVAIQKLNRFKSIIIGGAAVHESLKIKIQNLSCAVYATYGMTETVSHIALQKLNGADRSEYFTVLTGITINKDERECLVIQLPEIGKPIITNDIIEIIDPTKFRWLGRYDNIINSGGIKLVPESIENKINLIFNDSGITQSFFVTGIPDERLGQKLILIVEGNEFPQRTEILHNLREKLPSFENPKQVIYLEEFVRTDTQKINRIKTIEKALKTIN